MGYAPLTDVAGVFLWATTETWLCCRSLVIRQRIGAGMMYTRARARAITASGHVTLCSEDVRFALSGNAYQPRVGLPNSPICKKPAPSSLTL